MEIRINRCSAYAKLMHDYTLYIMRPAAVEDRGLQPFPLYNPSLLNYRAFIELMYEYNDLIIEGHINENILTIDKAILKGKGHRKR